MGREGERKGLVVVRGALDKKVILFRAHANVVRCDITEDVELGCKWCVSAHILRNFIF